MPPESSNTPPVPSTPAPTPTPQPPVRTPPPTPAPTTPPVVQTLPATPAPAPVVTSAPVVAPVSTPVQTTTPPVAVATSSGLPKWAIPAGALGVVLLLGGFLWFTGILGSLGSSSEESETLTPEEQAAAQAPINDLPTASNNASDDAILKDSAAIDAEIQGLSSDSASVDESLNDKPVSQEY